MQASLLAKSPGEPGQSFRQLLEAAGRDYLRYQPGGKRPLKHESARWPLNRVRRAHRQHFRWSHVINRREKEG